MWQHVPRALRCISTSARLPTLHCDPRSTCSQKCLLTIAECGALDRVRVELVNLPQSVKERQDIDGEYRKKIHPFGKVPILFTADGTRIYETHAITTYLNAALGGKLFPDDALGQAQVHQWMSFHGSYWKPAMFPIYSERVLMTRFGRGDPDEAKVAAAAAESGKVLDVIEAHLAEQQQMGRGEYLVGAEFSLADIYFLPETQCLATQVPEVLDAQQRPLVGAWWRRISARRSFAENRALWAAAFDPKL